MVKMKWLFYFFVLVYVCYGAVYGAKLDTGSISVEQIDYGDAGYLEVGTQKTITCKLFNRNKLANMLEWIDPHGKLVSKTPGRIFSKENVVATNKAWYTGLVLNLRYLSANDTGVYTCKYGKQTKKVPLCVIKATEFGDTRTEVLVESGRSITLHCKVLGIPEPVLKWYRDGVEITDDDKYRLNKIFNVEGYEGLLTIVSAGPEDDGVYTCKTEQENPRLENCTNTEALNITVLVSQIPWFETNNTIHIYGNENDNVELKCKARGWPKPTYRWFEDIGGETLHEFDQNKITLSEDGHVASIHVTAGPETFKQTYKCQATNSFGETDQYFKLLETTKPQKADDIELSFATDSELVFNVTWDNELLFPVDSFAIQFMKTSSLTAKKPREYEWKKASLSKMEIDREEYVGDEPGMLVKLESLETDTIYWVRVRAVNDVGEAPWSDAIVASTSVPQLEEPETAELDIEVDDSRTFYGIFFAGAIAITVAVCMFIMRLV